MPIVTVEARHAAAVALLIDPANVEGSKGMAPDGGFDIPRSNAAILRAVRATGFIKG